MKMSENTCTYKRSYDIQKVIACAEKGSNREAARNFDVDEKRVREWRKTNDVVIEDETD